MASGTTFGAPTAIEVEFAETLGVGSTLIKDARMIDVD